MKVLECCAVSDIQWKEIQKNPEMWARSAKIPELVAVIKKASASYYNTETTFLTDAAWDKLYDVLAERSPSNPLLTRTGSTSTGRKVRLPHFMPSLTKRKTPAAVAAWLESYPGPYVVSEKIDGTSLMIDYLGNGDYKLYTRGTGSSGQDVTRIGQYLKIPAVSQKMTVRAEVVMPKSQLERLRSQAADPDKVNIRNTVNGLVNRSKSDSPELKKARVVAYEVIAPTLKPSIQFTRLKSLGFTVSPFKVFDDLSYDSLNEMLPKRKSSSIYDIDGLVVIQDKRHTRPTSGYPDYTIAFKDDSLAPTYEATVISVEWTPSKNAYLKPRVNLEPIKHHTGVTISWTNGINAKFIYDNKIGPGAILKLTRAGDVIPKIEGMIKKARKPQMPDVEWDWNETGVDAVLLNSEESDAVLLRQLLFFFTTLGVEGLRSGTISKFMSIGLDTPVKIIKASITKMLEADGIQEITARKMRQNLDKALQNATLSQLMAASGLFGRNMGVTLLDTLVQEIPNIMKLREGPTLANRVANLFGFSGTRATQFMEGLPKFKKFYESLGITVRAPRAVKPTSSVLEGEKVVFTGFRDKELEQQIVQNGGTVGTAVNRATTILLVKSMAEATSTKAVKAQELGVKIMTADVFRKRFRLS